MHYTLLQYYNAAELEQVAAPAKKQAAAPEAPLASIAEGGEATVKQDGQTDANPEEIDLDLDNMDGMYRAKIDTLAEICCTCL